METKNELKKSKDKKWIVVLSIIIFFIAIKFYNVKKEDKVVETIDESWGLGKKVTESVSNDRDYDWYVDQLKEELRNEGNCGPASIEMAARWKNKDSILKAEEIRKNYLKEGGGTNKAVACKVFDENNIKYREMYDCLFQLQHKGKGAFLEGLSDEKKAEAKTKYSTSYYMTKEQIEKTKQDIKEEIKNGNIVMTAFQCGRLTYNFDSEKRCGAYYNVTGPHWIIIKGYKVVDNKLFFQVYDPNGGELRYKDGTLMAKDRYYLADEIMETYFNAISIIK